MSRTKKPAPKRKSDTTIKQIEVVYMRYFVPPVVGSPVYPFRMPSAYRAVDSIATDRVEGVVVGEVNAELEADPRRDQQVKRSTRY